MQGKRRAAYSDGRLPAPEEVEREREGIMRLGGKDGALKWLQKSGDASREEKRGRFLVLRPLKGTDVPWPDGKEKEKPHRKEIKKRKRKNAWAWETLSGRQGER